MLDRPSHSQTVAHDTWTDARIDTLRNMWADGKSASMIATELGGVSRSAVIGKIHRLKLPKRAKTTSSAQRQKPHGNAGQPKVNAIIARAAAKIKPPRENFDMEDGDGTDVTHMVSRQNIEIGTQCYWGYGDPLTPEFRYCGAPTNDRASYCPKHAARSRK